MIQASIFAKLWAARSPLAKAILAGLLQGANLHQAAQSSALRRMQLEAARRCSLQLRKRRATPDSLKGSLYQQRSARRSSLEKSYQQELSESRALSCGKKQE